METVYLLHPCLGQRIEFVRETEARSKLRSTIQVRPVILERYLPTFHDHELPTVSMQ